MNITTRKITQPTRLVACLFLMHTLAAGTPAARPQDDAHEGHAHEEETVAIDMHQEKIAEFDIAIQEAAPGEIPRTVSLPGEVVFNADQLAHVTPTVSGIVRKVRFSVGDRVRKGDVMAELNSRELAAQRSEYLATHARLALAEENLERDRRLFEDKVGTERAVLESQQAFKEARIAVDQAENALHALGYSHHQIDQVNSIDPAEFNNYQLISPLNGMVTDRHLTVGEVVGPTGNGSPFVVSDLSNVWVNLTVYQRDLVHVKKGQRVLLQFGHGIPDARATISFVSPSLDKETRTATARIVLDNPDGHWRPGLFLTGKVFFDAKQGRVVVPREAIQNVDGRPTLFVRSSDGFEPRPVKLGALTEQQVEILEGLDPGEPYAARNSFILKAELNRAALEHAGHAH